MKLIFWGFLLVFLDFSLTFNGVGFDLLPDSVGYLLVFLGAGRMREESGSFSRMRPISLVLAIVNFAALIINPFGPIELTYSWPAALAVTAFSLLMLFLYLYLLWLLVRGVQDMEQYYGCPFNAHTMRKAFIVTLCISITAQILAWIPYFVLLILPLGLAVLVTSIVLLVLLWRAAKTYDRLCDDSGPSDGNDEYYPGSED